MYGLCNICTGGAQFSILLNLLPSVTSMVFSAHSGMTDDRLCLQVMPLPPYLVERRIPIDYGSTDSNSGIYTFSILNFLPEGLLGQISPGMLPLNATGLSRVKWQ
jgi:hypothetical protein